MRHRAPLGIALLSIATLSAVAGAQDRRGGFGRGRRGPMPPSPIMEVLDADSDGALSADEIDAAVEELLTLDRDGDENLSAEELAPAPPPEGERGGRGGLFGPPGPGGMAGMMGGMMRMSPIMSALDLDGDGELFDDEVSEATELLLTLDRNDDGRLAADELEPDFGGSGGFGGFGSGRGPGGPGGGRGGFPGGRGGQAPARMPEPSEIEAKDGAAELPDRAAFEALSYKGDEVLIDTHLAGLEFIKFMVVGAATDEARIYFINTVTHRAHMMFGSAVGLPFRPGGDDGAMMGVLVYRPMLTGPGGEPGLYTFEFEPFDRFSFDNVQVAFDLLCEHAPIVRDQLAYHALPEARVRYEEEIDLYQAADLPVFLPEHLYKDIGFLPLNHAQGFGRLRLMDLDERPGPRDIVVYANLPNEMPRVAGIITAAHQTPLSHVNLRAVQDRVPNAFITGADTHPKILELVDHSVFYSVDADGYELRKASTEEVEEHFAALRPAEPQIPERDLSATAIRSLDDLGFDDARAVGVKAASLAAMRDFELPEGMIPAGYAVPFWFYDGFMKHNGFYTAAEKMMSRESFGTDSDAREKALKKFRKKVKNGEMPGPLLAALADVQAEFPEGTSIRCRSSTNNEDLPGFSGAGLYDSYTHKPDEGHLEKSIKQVYASLWNFRAFEEREFFRIDHERAAMGVLLHPNFSDETVNGVAVTDNIVYQADPNGGAAFYVNSQVGEDLVTNPDRASVPEEMLLAPRNPKSDRIIRHSNQVANGTELLSAAHRLELRRALRSIEKNFAELYQAGEDAPFAMEIEFKITEDGKLAIKQARPWVY